MLPLTARLKDEVAVLVTAVAAPAPVRLLIVGPAARATAPAVAALS